MKLQLKITLTNITEFNYFYGQGKVRKIITPLPSSISILILSLTKGTLQKHLDNYFNINTTNTIVKSYYDPTVIIGDNVFATSTRRLFGLAQLVIPVKMVYLLAENIKHESSNILATKLTKTFKTGSLAFHEQTNINNTSIIIIIIIIIIIDYNNGSFIKALKTTGYPFEYLVNISDADILETNFAILHR